MGLTKTDLKDIRALNPSNETYKYHKALLELYCSQYEMLEKIEQSLREINAKLWQQEPVNISVPIAAEKPQPPPIKKTEEGIKPFKKMPVETEKDVKKSKKAHGPPRGRRNPGKRK